MILSMKWLIIAFITLFSIPEIFSQNDCSFDSTKIIFGSKLYILNEILLDRSKIDDYEDLHLYLKDLDRMKIHFLDSEGFNEYSCKFVFISLGMGEINDNLFTISPYVLGFLKSRSYTKFYRLAGFEENDFELLINDLPKFIPYREKELLKVNYFCNKFSIEGIDFMCLFSALKDRRQKDFHSCLYSNLRYKRFRYTKYYFKKGKSSKAKNQEINRLRSMSDFTPLQRKE